MSVISRVQTVFNAVFERDDVVLTKETTAHDVDEWDSMMHIQLIMALEQEFGVRFALGELADLKNVGDALDLIHKKIKE